MSKVAIFNAELAKAEEVSEAKRKAMQDLSLDDLFSFRRELKHADVEGLGRVYFYAPQSVAEREEYQKHIRLSQDGISISMNGIVDGVIARVRTKDGKPLFQDADRKRLLGLSFETLTDIWNAMGGDSAKPISEAHVATIEKK